MTYDDFISEWQNTDCDFILAHTSGSTGTPKPIRLSKADMIVSARATNTFFGIKSGDILVAPLAADYIAGKMMAVRALDSGARLIVESPSRNPLSTLPPELPIKLVAIVPQQIDGLLKSHCPIENVIVGGGATPSDFETRALALRPTTQWWATYGMTETCSHVALRRFGEKVYTALPGVQFSTTSEGCLIINRSGASWSPVITNDVVELIDQFTFIFIGRADNAIVSGGIKIHPEEVESLIAPALGNRRFYISSRASEMWGEEVVLVVEGTPSPDGGEEILEMAAELAGRIRRPRAIVWLDQFPTTDSGKIKRRVF